MDKLTVGFIRTGLHRFPNVLNLAVDDAQAHHIRLRLLVITSCQGEDLNCCRKLLLLLLLKLLLADFKLNFRCIFGHVSP